MTDLAADAARSAAVILAPGLGPACQPRLRPPWPPATRSSGAQASTACLPSPVSVSGAASLIVSIAQFAWSISATSASTPPRRHPIPSPVRSASRCARRDRP
jgi:hypothetical protein